MASRWPGVEGSTSERVPGLRVDHDIARPVSGNQRGVQPLKNGGVPLVLGTQSIGSTPQQVGSVDWARDSERTEPRHASAAKPGRIGPRGARAVRIFSRHHDDRRSALDVRPERREEDRTLGNRVVHGSRPGARRRLIVREQPETVTLLIQPDSSIRNHRTEELAKLIASFYLVPSEHWRVEGKQIVILEPERINLRIVYQPNNISFYLVIPKKRLSAFERRLESIWERATIQAVDALPSLDPDQSNGANIHYLKHDLFSLKADHRSNAPLSSLMAPIREFQPGDMAILDALIEPYNRMQWEFEARNAYETLKQGRMPARFGSVHLAQKGFALFTSVVIFIRYSLLDLTAFTREQEAELRRMRRMEERDLTAIQILADLTPESKRKQTADVLKVSLRAAVQSPHAQRRAQSLDNLCTAWHDLDADNELVSTRVPSRRINVFLQAIEDQQPFRSRSTSMRMTTDEVGKVLQLPGDELQKAYPEINAIRKKEVSMSGELFQDVPGIAIGQVTEKGITRTAKIPLVAYDGAREKDVNDALCTPTFAFGKQGTGKTDGTGAGQALDMIAAGNTAFLIDTADGQVAKTLTDALQADYPEEKLIFLDFRNVKRAIPLTYADVSETVIGSGDDAELAELQMTTRLTSHLQEFLNRQSATGELTDRMRRYFVSAAKATRGRPMYIELALESSAYRAELLEDPFVQSQPDVVADLLSLQEKSENGTDRAIVTPILERLKTISRNPFLANVFLSEDRRDDSGNLLLNFRRYADNPEGGYGYCVIAICDKDTYGPDGQELICSTVQSKIFLAAYSRIDQDQSERKPFISVTDEPHRFIRGGAAKRLYSDAAVELRKYRCRVLMLAHSPEQLGEVWDSFSSGGTQIIAYKSENMRDYAKISRQLVPYDAEYVYQHLPEKWEAVCKLRLPSGKESPAFFAKMAPPPTFVKDRSKRREECGEIFGYHWKEAKVAIDGLRAHYQALDNEWLAKRQEEEQGKKLVEKERKAAEREARKQTAVEV